VSDEAIVWKNIVREIREWPISLKVASFHELRQDLRELADAYLCDGCLLTYPPSGFSFHAGRQRQISEGVVEITEVRYCWPCMRERHEAHIRNQLAEMFQGYSVSFRPMPLPSSDEMPGQYL